jgi:hypothetical protein
MMSIDQLNTGGTDDAVAHWSIGEIQFIHYGNYSLNRVQIDKNLFIAGGLISETEGKQVEAGFYLWPEPIALNAVQAAGGQLSDGTYYFKVTYEWADEEGQIHYSAPSLALEVTCANGTAVQRVDIDVPTLQYGKELKIANPGGTNTVTVNVYRLASDGLYHKEKGMQFNAYASLVVTVYGGLSTDANILENDILYTEGGVLDNIAPPASNIMAARKDRIFLVPDEDRYSVWYSKPKQPGRGVEFNDTFIKRFPFNGEITALGVLDDKVIVFKQNEIRAFSGLGPNAHGIGTFSEDFLVAQDIGCTDRCSVANSDAGIFFRGDRGIYLLNRSLQVQYVGAGVDDHKGEEVLRIVSVPDQNQIRVINTASETPVYDTLAKQWLLYDFAHSALDAVMWEGSFVFSSTTYSLYEENTVYFRDHDQQIQMKIETAWIKLNGLQGYQRVFWVGIVGSFESAHTLNIKVYYDYKTTATQTITKTVDATLGADAPYQFRFRPKFSRCEAMKLEIYESDASAPYDSCKISAIQLVIGVVPGLYRDKITKTL